MPALDIRVFALALLAAFGAFLVVSQFGLLQRFRVNVGRPVDLDEDAARMLGEERGGLAMFEGLPLLDRAVGPLIESLAGLLPKDDFESVERALDLLDYPGTLKSPSDYYANRVVGAVIGFVLGFVAAVGVTAGGAPAVMLAALPIGAGLIGYQAPKQSLQGKLARRRKLMLFEAPYLFDRLAVHYLSKQAIEPGLTALVSVPEGGYLMRELRQLAEDYNKGASWASCLERMKARNDDILIVQRFCDRLLLANKGADLISALNVISDRANQMVENEIRQAGAQNQALMIVPTLLSLGGIVILLIAPTAQMLGRVF